jgi:hypothetical protein
MPFLKLNFKPGINRDQTNYSGEGGWWDCDKVRFFSGFPQKLGGWQKATTFTFKGVCRQVWNWITTFSDNFLGVGTDVKLYIEAGGAFYDVTPLRTTLSSTDTDNCISTTNTSTTVTFTVVGHGCLSGDYVTISGVTGSGSPEAIADIPVSQINAEHVVTRVDDDNFTITVTTPADNTTSSQGGTAIDIKCQIHPGYPSTLLGYGWGAGSYSGNWGWGESGSTPIALLQRDWWISNFDNDMVANIRNGPIYYWERGSLTIPSTALNTRAILLSDLSGANSVPTIAMQTLVSQNDKHLLAFGCQPYAGLATDFDPLLIRWASQDEPQYWNPTGTTPGGAASSAGFLRVSRGSKIVSAMPTRQEILTWTDTTLYSLQFLGTTDVFGLQQLADNISLISPRAMATANNITYWLGTDKFYAYTGQVQTLPCTVRQYLFKDINYGQADQIVCGTNEGFNEIWWFYPSAESNWNNKYVVYNHLQNIWFFGTLDRTAWLDTPLRDYPSALYTAEYSYEDTQTGNVSNGNLYQHEIGVDDDGSAMNSYIQSHDFDLEPNGDQFMLTRRIIPDINYNQSTADTPTVTLSVRPRNFPGSQYQGDPSDTQNVIETATDIYTDQVYIRARARQMALKVASNQVGVQWQLGSPRLDVRPDGRR